MSLYPEGLSLPFLHTVQWSIDLVKFYRKTPQIGGFSKTNSAGLLVYNPDMSQHFFLNFPLNLDFPTKLVYHCINTYFMYGLAIAMAQT